MSTTRKHHVFLWIFLALQALFIVWIIVGSHNAQQTHCTGLNARDCANAKDVGNTLGVAFIILMWALTDIIVGGTYGIYRLVKRDHR